MRKTGDYTVVMEMDIHILIAKVAGFTKKGYVPIGGVTIDPSSDGRNAYRFYQAVWRSQ